jgi:hypothetical protein
MSGNVNIGKYGICPRCTFNLEVRKGAYGLFLGCSDWPRCRYSQTLSSPTELVAKAPTIINEYSETGQFVGEILYKAFQQEIPWKDCDPTIQTNYIEIARNIVNSFMVHLDYSHIEWAVNQANTQNGYSSLGHYFSYLFDSYPEE